MSVTDGTPAHRNLGKSVLNRLAPPYTFAPNLGLVEALFAVAGSLTRVFSTCLLFAFWGAFSIWAWDTIGNRFLRAAALLPLILVFAAALFLVMAGIAAVERKLVPKH